MSDWHQPHIIFSLIDIVRYDTFGFGRKIVPSRYLHDLAGQAAFFPHAIAPDTYTPTSHASVFTGRDAIYHCQKGPQKPYYGLADFLNFNGYDTLLMADNPYFMGLLPYLSGFEKIQLLKDQTAIDDERSFMLYPPEKALHSFGRSAERNNENNIFDWITLFDRFRDRTFEDFSWVEVDDYYDTAEYIYWRYRDLCAYLKEREPRPLFCFFNIMGYLFWIKYKQQTASWWKNFYKANFNTTPSGRELELLCRYFEDTGLFMKDTKLSVPLALAEVSQSLYLACSGAIHRALMEKLRQHRIMTDESVNILSVDHGHMWREHGEKFMEHGPTNNVYQQLIRIPLIIKSPFMQKGTYEAPVMLTDVFPTLNQWISAFSPVAAECFNPYYAQSLALRITDDCAIVFRTEADSIVGFDGPYKFIYNQKVGKKSCLFDIAQDPGEDTNIYHQAPSNLLSRHRKMIANYSFSESSCIRAVSPLAKNHEFTGIQQETVNALKALGYLE